MADETPDLAQFLTDRWDEEEQVAALASHTGSGAIGGHWRTGCTCDGECTEYGGCKRVEGDNITIYAEGGHDADQARHIAYWDPARVLAEIAAKRAILTDYQIVLANNAIEAATDDSDETEVRTAARGLIAKSLRMVLLRLAAAYAAHPAYRPEWRVA